MNRAVESPGDQWRLGLSATLFAFGTYFCMYAFRKPFAAAGYAGEGYFGLELKTTFVISQVVGYTLSKYVGIRVVSEATRTARLRLLIGLVLLSELALVAFALLPREFRPLAILLNGLPLGMIWGLVVRYLEGRRTSELLLSGLSVSFIVASGVVKDVGRWALDDVGIDEYWMPACVGLFFLPAFVLFARCLDGIADPTADDERARMARTEMPKAQRRHFVRQHLGGMLLLLATYFALTAFRDFRDNYGVEMIAELGYANEAAPFTRTEIPVAIAVLVVMAALGVFQRPMTGLVAVFGVMTAGMVLVGLATLGLDAGWLGGEAWMITVGLGLYLAYVPFSSFLFDRIMAATRHVGTAVFAINLADAIGYTGSVGLQLYKDLLTRDSTHLEFFRGVSYALSVGASSALIAALVYFTRRARVL